jgi:hypothetical protein
MARQHLGRRRQPAPSPEGLKTMPVNGKSIDRLLDLLRSYLRGEPNKAELEHHELREVVDSFEYLKTIVDDQFDLLELHRRFHAKVGCPGKDCVVCMAEDQFQESNS